MSDYKKKISDEKKLQEYKQSIAGDKDKLETFQKYAPYLSNIYVQGFLDSLVQFESGGNKYAKNPGWTDDQGVFHKSSARGLFQFIDETADSTQISYGVDPRATHKYGEIEQTLAALALMDEQGAINDIRVGDFDAINEKLGGTWDSLPSGTKYGRKDKSEWMKVYGASMAESGVKTDYSPEEVEAMIINDLESKGDKQAVADYKKYKLLSEDIVPQFTKAYNELKSFNNGEEYEEWRKEKDKNGRSVTSLERDIRLLKQKDAKDGLEDDERIELENKEKFLLSKYSDRSAEFQGRMTKYTDDLKEYMADDDVRDMMGEDFFTYNNAIEQLDEINNTFNETFEDFDYDNARERGVLLGYKDEDGTMNWTKNIGQAIEHKMWSMVGEDMYTQEDVMAGYEKGFKDVGVVLETLEESQSPLGTFGKKWMDYEHTVNKSLNESITSNAKTYNWGATGTGGWQKIAEKKAVRGDYDAPDPLESKDENLKKLETENAELKASLADYAQNPQLKNMNDEDFVKYMNEVGTQREETGVSRIASIFGEGTIDSALQFAGMAAAYKAATAPLPHQVKSPEWKDHMHELRQRANRGLSNESKTMYTREMDRTYSYDVANVARFSRSSQAALAALGGAGARRNDAALKLTAMNEEAKMKNYQAYGQGLAQDEAMTQAYWERNHYNEASRKRDLKAALIGQMTKNIREDRLYARQYGEGSYYAKYMNALAQDKEESAIATRAAQLKDSSITKDGQEYALSGKQAYELATAQYHSENPQRGSALTVNQVMNQSAEGAKQVGSTVAAGINQGTTFLVNKSQQGVQAAADKINYLKDTTRAERKSARIDKRFQKQLAKDEAEWMTQE